MSNSVKRLIVLLISVALVIGIPATALAAPNIPEPSVGEGVESTINEDDKAEASTNIDIYVYGELEITSQTEDCLIEEGDDLDLMVTVSGVGPFTYTWEVSEDGGATWETPEGAANSNTYQIIDAQAEVEDNVVQQYAYRVTVEDKFGNEVSTVINIGVKDSISYRRILDEEDQVAVSAWMLKSTKLHSEKIGEGNAAYDELYRHLTPGCLPINAVDLSLYNDTVEDNFFIGEQQVEFIVGEEYNGQTLKVFQLLDGEVIEYSGVVENGILTITVEELSQFMVEAPSDDAHIITVVAGEGGSASPNGQVTVKEGDDQKIVFLPDEGYVIDEVLVDGEPVDVKNTNYYVLEDITEDHTVEVSFEKVEDKNRTYPVNVIVKDNGSASPSGYFRVNHGDSVSINITPDPGYEIKRVLVNWDYKYEPIGNYFVLPAVTEETVVVIEFCKTDEDPVAVNRVITATAGEGGSISPAGETQVQYGGDMYYYIIPDEGYVIDKVYIDGVESSDTDGSYHFVTVVDDHTIHATFKEGDTPAEQYVTIKAESGDNGSISPAGELQVPKGGDQTFHFTPDTGYVVRAVYVNGKLVANGGMSYTIENVTADTTIRVEFAPVALIPTGDITPEAPSALIWVMLGVAGGVAILMIILIILRRKKDEEEDEGQDINENPLN